MMARGPRIKPKINIPTIPTTSDVMARQFVFLWTGTVIMLGAVPNGTATEALGTAVATEVATRGVCSHSNKEKEVRY